MICDQSLKAASTKPVEMGALIYSIVLTKKEFNVKLTLSRTLTQSIRGVSEVNLAISSINGISLSLYVTFIFVVKAKSKTDVKDRRLENVQSHQRHPQ